MTGVYNRAYLDQVLAREFEHSSRHKWPLSVAFADLDNFKGINDRFGHQAGDRILQATARILRGNTRETDLIARYGGEEFVVVLPATDADTAHSICERIVTAFQNTAHTIGSDQRTRDHLDRLRDPRSADSVSERRRIRQGRRPGALHRKAARPQPHRPLRSAAAEGARRRVGQIPARTGVRWGACARFSASRAPPGRIKWSALDD